MWDSRVKTILQQNYCEDWIRSCTGRGHVSSNAFPLVCSEIQSYSQRQTHSFTVQPWLTLASWDWLDKTQSVSPDWLSSGHLGHSAPISRLPGVWQCCWKWPSSPGLCSLAPGLSGWETRIILTQMSASLQPAMKYECTCVKRVQTRRWSCVQGRLLWPFLRTMQKDKQ